jgi:integrase
LHATGCRPGEAVRITPGDVDLARGCATLADHKTARKTGRIRLIVIPESITPMVRELCEAVDGGPIFRNEDGRAWCKNSWNCQARRISARMGQPFHLYQLRHLYATDLLASGTPVSVVAGLLGHADATTTLRVYDHVAGRVDLLRKAAGEVR